MRRKICMDLEVNDDDEKKCSLFCKAPCLERGYPSEYIIIDNEYKTVIKNRLQACLDADITLKQALYEGAASIAFSQGAKIAELKKRNAVLERAMEIFISDYLRLLHPPTTHKPRDLYADAIEQAEEELEGQDETQQNSNT